MNRVPRVFTRRSPSKEPGHEVYAEFERNKNYVLITQVLFFFFFVFEVDMLLIFSEVSKYQFHKLYFCGIVLNVQLVCMRSQRFT